MNKVTPKEGQSTDIIAENIEQMKELFPEAFTEDGVNFDTLRQLLGDAKVLDEGEEKYGLNWHGKKKARQIALTPSTGTLLPCPEESVDWDTTKNLFIEGDNLEVLKLLQKSYANKVKMIYIDPPYNTGKEFIYPDKFQDNLDTYLKYTGQKSDESYLGELEKKAGALPYEDEYGDYDLWELRNRNPKFGRHNRPNLFYPIYVNKNSVSGEGLAEISLGQNEEFCVEVFPRNSDGDDSCWRWGKPKLINEGILSTPKTVWAKQKRDGGWNIYEKSRKSTTKAKSIWADTQVISEQGTVEAGRIEMGGLLEFPKPLELIKRCVLLGTDKDDIVMDFFAGTGTTAHAVMAQSLEDGLSRRYICVQLPEPTYELENDKKKPKKHSKTAFECGYETIAEISRERIKRSSKLLVENNPDKGIDIGFRTFKLANSNIQIWNPDRTDLEETLLSHQEHLIEGRSEQDVFYELLLKRGVDLAVSIETRDVAGKNIYSIDYGVLFTCLDESITHKQVENIAQAIIDWHTELSPSSETHVFFRDNAFRDDVSKTNMAAILEQNGITHVRSL